MTQDSSTYWKKSRVEVRAAGFDPDRAAEASAIVTIASAWTNAHRCNNRVRAITDLLVDLIAERGGQGLVVGAPAVSDALTQGTPTAGYSLVSRDVAADCFEIGHYAHHGDAMIVISGCDKTGAAAGPLFWLMHGHEQWMILAGQLGFVVLVGGYYGCLPAFMVEAVPKEVRCTAIALGYNVSLGLIGGLSPLAATWLVHRTDDDYSPAFMIMAAAAISFLVLLVVRGSVRPEARFVASAPCRLYDRREP